MSLTQDDLKSLRGAIKEEISPLKKDLAGVKKQVSEIPGIKTKVFKIEKQVAKIPEIEKQVAEIPDIKKQVAKIPEIEKQVAKIPKIQKDISQIQKDVSTMLRVLDEQDIKTSKRVARIENHLNLPPIN